MTNLKNIKIAVYNWSLILIGVGLGTRVEQIWYFALTGVVLALVAEPILKWVMKDS